MSSITTHNARAVVACLLGGDDAFVSLMDLCEHAGYDLYYGAGSPPADIGLVDLRNERVTIRRVAAICAEFRKKSAEAPIIFVLAPSALSRMGPLLKRFGEVIPAQANLDQVVARIREVIRMRNVAEETGERLKTLTSLNRAVEFPVIATDVSPPRVLIVGAPGPSAIAAINMIASVADICACVLTAGQAMRALDHQVFDVALFLPSEENGAIPALIRALRRHPKFCRTALIEIADSAEDAADSARRGGADFLVKSQIGGVLGSRIVTATRRARLMHSMREFLRACAGEGVRDSSAGVFTPTFLGQHGARLVARAEQTGRPFSIVAARLTDEDAEEKTASRAAMRQAAKLLGRITRAEDLAARVAADTFVIVLPATRAADARNIALRVDGVLSNTAFRRDAAGRAHAMQVDIGVAEHVRETAIGETVAEAIKQLRARPASQLKSPALLGQSPQ